MRYFFTCLSAALLLAACSSSQGTGMRVKVQDPCMAQCNSLFNRCTDESGGDLARCNQDRSACEAQCTADEVTEEEGEGVITDD